MRSGGSTNAVTMKATFRRAGANDATPKSPLVCNAAVPSAADPMKKM
jgi:hypothetical protein